MNVTIIRIEAVSMQFGWAIVDEEYLFDFLFLNFSSFWYDKIICNLKSEKKEREKELKVVGGNDGVW